MSPSKPSNFNGTVHVTYITTATAILEINGVSFLTNPIFDNAPVEYEVTHLMPEGTQSMITKVEEGPAHEDHIDNLDESGRRLLNGRRFSITPDGAKNFAPRPGVGAIKPWETLTYNFTGVQWKTTGTPCTHLPGGEVTGFILQTEKFGLSAHGLPDAVYFTGDTILMPEHSEIRKSFHMVVMNLGDARFPLPGRDELL
ncbi:hypothetical protein QQZ08_010086 [Neonectria magnoliae]|uniref:Metallo-beta-lactamase domain-containing protein n=1 Tax=Neonectria magnoliae TaxID=2732573 RepID=A0ABR1HKU2_9HYPO